MRLPMKPVKKQKKLCKQGRLVRKAAAGDMKALKKLKELYGVISISKKGDTL